MSVASSVESVSEKIGTKSIYKNNWNKILEEKPPIAVEDFTDFFEKLESKKFSMFIGSILIMLIFYALKPSFVTRPKISKYDSVELDSLKFFFASFITIAALCTMLTK